ncbi:MAG: GldG family protein [Candidatus Aminicenantes bacterium]|nr:MAG: GldG family protein [Candidatus Aminicenantes bacterium]
MEKIKKNLNYIALALILLAFVSFRIWPYKKAAPTILFSMGIIALVTYIVMNLAILKQSFKRKSFIYSSNLLLVIVLVIGILAIINYFFAKHHFRMDFTESKLHSLSDQSVTVLKALDEDVNIKLFFREGNYGRAGMEHLMEIYSYHSNKVKYEFIDPDKNPGLVKRYEIAEDGTAIFESGEKESRITSNSEEDITNAIIEISREGKKVIYFLEGHGEASLEEAGDNGYSIAKDELEKLAYEVKNLALALEDNFPDDISLLIIPGPQKDLLPNELETIRNYIQTGGRVFFMTDPETSPVLTPYLADFGVQLESDLIVDTVSRLLGGDYFMPVVNEYELHTITDKFRYATFFPYARSVSPTEEKPEGITVEPIAKSSQNSWSERQLDQQEVTFNEENDVGGPISLAVVVTIQPKEEIQPTETEPEEEDTEQEKEKQDPAEETKPKQEGRIAVFGDSDFVTNRYYYLSGNGNFFLNTVNWLTEEEDLIAIQPKTSSPHTIQLSPSQGRLIFFVSLIILPLAVLITGISVWVRRRSL